MEVWFSAEDFDTSTSIKAFFSVLRQAKAAITTSPNQVRNGEAHNVPRKRVSRGFL
jgi:hypothetical protein